MNRDSIVNAVANWVISTFASQWYKDELAYTYALGMSLRKLREEEN